MITKFSIYSEFIYILIFPLILKQSTIKERINNPIENLAAFRRLLIISPREMSCVGPRQTHETAEHRDVEAFIAQPCNTSNKFAQHYSPM
jgi:hypothetical protein